MKVTIESTDQIVEIVNNGNTTPARVWTGTTESGIPVRVLVTLIAAPLDQDQSEFKRELQETRAPVTYTPGVFPLRMVL